MQVGVWADTDWIVQELWNRRMEGRPEEGDA